MHYTPPCSVMGLVYLPEVGGVHFHLLPFEKSFMDNRAFPVWNF